MWYDLCSILSRTNVSREKPPEFFPFMWVLTFTSSRSASVLRSINDMYLHSYEKFFLFFAFFFCSKVVAEIVPEVRSTFREDQDNLFWMMERISARKDKLVFLRQLCVYNFVFVSFDTEGCCTRSRVNCCVFGFYFTKCYELYVVRSRVLTSRFVL